jgi:hypothetical protein
MTLQHTGPLPSRPQDILLRRFFPSPENKGCRVKPSLKRTLPWQQVAGWRCFLNNHLMVLPDKNTTTAAKKIVQDYFPVTRNYLDDK